MAFIMALSLFVPVSAKEQNNQSNIGDPASIIYPETEVVYDDGDTIIINDYEGLLLTEELQSMQAIFSLYPQSIEPTIAWLLIAKTIVKWTWGAVGTCSAIVYVTGHDACREVIRYVTNPPKINVTYEYDVNAHYISGYIPGCEPRHSGPCNAGYWQYKISRR